MTSPQPQPTEPAQSTNDSGVRDGAGQWVLYGVGAGVLLVLGWLAGLGFLVYALYALTALVLLSALLAREWTNRIEAVREGVRREAGIGETDRVTVAVRNTGRFKAYWLLLEDFLPRDAFREHPPRLRVQGTRMRVTSLAAGEETVLEYAVTFQARGYYQIGPLLVESGDLFGLRRRYRIVSEPVFVTVFPNVVSLASYDIASRRPVGEVRMTHRLFEDPTRISGVRRYERGDPLNRIHWRATARTGLLHSKVYEPSSLAGATILLDFHESHYSGEENRARKELAVTSAASLANALYDLGQPVGLVSNGQDAAERIRQEGWQTDFFSRRVAERRLDRRRGTELHLPLVLQKDRGPAQHRRILETLARLETGGGLAFPDMVAETAKRLPRDATIVAIVAEVTAKTAIALGDLRRQGFAVTVLLVDFHSPGYRPWAQPPSWAGYLIAEQIDFRRIDSEEALAQLCGEYACG